MPAVGDRGEHRRVSLRPSGPFGAVRPREPARGMGWTSAAATARPLTLVATQRPLLVEAIKSALGRSPRFVVEPLELDPGAARASAAQSAAAVVVDVEPAPAVSLRLCQELRACRPALPILVLLCCPDGPPDFYLRALRTIGIGGVLTLDLPAEQVVAAIERVLRGGFAMDASPSQAAALGVEPDRRLTWRGARGDERPVTARDAELLGLVKEGLSDAEIGRRLHLSPSTVKSEIGTWCRRVGAIGRVQLAVWAERNRF